MPVADSRELAVTLLNRIATKHETLEQAIALTPIFNQLSDQDQRFTKQIVLMTLRDYGRLERLIISQFQTPPKPALLRKVMPILMIGACQLCLMDVPDYAVFAKMKQVAIGRKLSGLTKLIHAILKKISTDSLGQLPIEENLPSFLLQQWRADYGESTAQAICGALRTPPPLDLAFKNKEAMTSFIEQATPSMKLIILTDSPPYFVVRLPNPIRRVNDLPDYKKGNWWVQNIAANLAISTVGAVEGLSVLDLCAAPGGKTLQLCAAGAKVTAVDIDQQRMKRLQDNLTRTGLSAELITQDGLTYKPEHKFDIVVVDAPCSATGTIRRHPEILRRLANQIDYERQLATLTDLQHKLIAHAASLLNPQGILLYCVCSLDRKEGYGQYQTILKHQAQLGIMPSPIPALKMAHTTIDSGHSTVTLTPAQEMDGFFIAKFKKVK